MSQRHLLTLVLVTAVHSSQLQAQNAVPASVGVRIPASDPSYTLTHVAGVAELSDGSLLVLQPEDRSLLHFSSRGEFLRRVGRNGDGPGEFRWPLGMGLHKGRVWIWDTRLRRMSLLNDTLGLDSTIALRESGMAWLLSNGSIVLQVVDVPKPAQMQQAPREATLVLIENAKRRTLVSWPATSSTVTIELGMGVAVTVRQPFNEVPLWAVAPGGEYAAIVRHPTSSLPGSLTVISAAGDTLSSVKLQWPTIAVTDRIFRMAVDSVLQTIESSKPTSVTAPLAERSAVEGAIRRPKRISTVTGLSVGADGVVWVRRPASDHRWSEWVRFTSTGKESGRVLLPANVRVLLFTTQSAWTATDGEQGPTISQFLLPKP
jgi:hypothetical protein